MVCAPSVLAEVRRRVSGKRSKCDAMPLERLSRNCTLYRLLLSVVNKAQNSALYSLHSQRLRLDRQLAPLFSALFARDCH